jgi:hypothetical protein
MKRAEFGAKTHLFMSGCYVDLQPMSQSSHFCQENEQNTRLHHLKRHLCLSGNSEKENLTGGGLPPGPSSKTLSSSFSEPWQLSSCQRMQVVPPA